MVELILAIISAVPDEYPRLDVQTFHGPFFPCPSIFELCMFLA